MNRITVRKENQGGTVDELLYASGNYSFTSDGMKCFLVDSDNPRSRIGQAKAALREIPRQATGRPRPDFPLGHQLEL